MDTSPSVKDIMTREVISVRPETSVLEAHELIAKHNFDGVPVVDHEKRLVGILTEYDLVSKGSAIHLPTFQLILQNLKVFRRDRQHFEHEIQSISSLTVKDVMNSDPLTLPEDATFEQAVMAFRNHHRVNPIPVIDRDRRVVGVVSRYDVLKLFGELKVATDSPGR